jgi:hypothetical protein
VLDRDVRDLDEQEGFVARRLRPGAVVVLHEGYAHRSRVVQLTDRVLGVLARRGLRPVGLSELHAAAAG